MKLGKEQQFIFKKLKELLRSDAVLVHFDSKLPLGIACDVGKETAFFHRYPNGDEKPIANVSKLLSFLPRRKFSVVFGRTIYLVTNYKSFLALFHPSKPTADTLTRLPSGEKAIFDEEEESEDTDILCAIEALSLQINTTDLAIVKENTSKYLVVARVMQFIFAG